MPPPRRAQREAHADLARALDDREGRHRVDSGESEQERGRAEDLEQDGLKAAVREGGVDRLLHRPDRRGRDVGIESAQLPADSGGEEGRVALRPNGQAENVCEPDGGLLGRLRIGDVDVGAAFGVEARKLHVADDPDDLDRTGRLLVVDAQARADRALSRRSVAARASG